MLPFVRKLNCSENITQLWFSLSADEEDERRKCWSFSNFLVCNAFAPLWILSDQVMKTLEDEWYVVIKAYKLYLLKFCEVSLLHSMNQIMIVDWRMDDAYLTGNYHAENEQTWYVQHIHHSKGENSEFCQASKKLWKKTLVYNWSIHIAWEPNWIWICAVVILMILAWFLTDIFMQSVSTTEVKWTGQVAIGPSACLQPG